MTDGTDGMEGVVITGTLSFRVDHLGILSSHLATAILWFSPLNSGLQGGIENSHLRRRIQTSILVIALCPRPPFLVCVPDLRPNMQRATTQLETDPSPSDQNLSELPQK